jgi:hypothetical protein
MSENPYKQFTSESPDSTQLAQLGDLANDLFLAELKLLEAQEKSREAQELVRNIAEQQIPELMDDLGLASFETKSGVKLTVADVIRASIPKVRREEAYKWMDDEGYGDLVKHNVTISFGRDEGDQAEELIEDLDAKGLRVKDEKKVESSTLRKFVGDRLEEGADIPMDLFGAAQFRKAKIVSRPETIFGD